MPNDKKPEYPTSRADEHWEGGLRPEVITAKDLNELSELMNEAITFVDTPDGPRDAATLPRPSATNSTMSAKAAGKRPAEGPERSPEEEVEEEEEEEEVQPPSPPKKRGPGRPRKEGGPKKYVPTGKPRGRPKGSKNKTDKANDYEYMDEDE